MACSQDWAAERRKDQQDYILEPLSLPESPGGISAEEASPSVPCLFCEEYYPISEQNQILKHMIIKHKLIIADVKLIADFRSLNLELKTQKRNRSSKLFYELPTTLPSALGDGESTNGCRLYFCPIRSSQPKLPCPSWTIEIPDFDLISPRTDVQVWLLGRYLLYWEKRFREQPIANFCCIIRTNSEAALEDQDEYFLLCDALPEDRELREKLQQQRLKDILDQQQQERYDADFHYICMFCDQPFSGNRSVLLNHMTKDHAFNIGLPDNIVNCKEFLDVLQKKIDSFQCLYCEKTFEDKNKLKDHMRKKQHRKINAKNQEYDRFYIINYLEFGKSWEQIQSEDDRELFHNQEEDWSDWEEHPVCAVCLFCEKQDDTTEKLCVHMEEAHGFNLLKIKSEYDLNFYQQVKLVNFIRRQVHQCQCFKCEKKFQLKKELIHHLEDSKHIADLPNRSVWDQPQYYFPTYENDTLLCALSDNEDGLTAEKQTENVSVISEDISNIEALKQSSVLNELLHDELNNIET